MGNLPKAWRGAEAAFVALEADPATAGVVAIVLRPLIGRPLNPPFGGDPADYATALGAALAGHPVETLTAVANAITSGKGAFEARKRDFPPVADVIALAAPYATARAARGTSAAYMAAAGLPAPTATETADLAAFGAAVQRIRGGAEIWTGYHLDVARVVRRPGRPLLLVVPTSGTRTMLANHARSYLDDAARALGATEVEIIAAAEYARKHTTPLAA